MIMRVRKFGEPGPWVEVEHVPVDACGFCAVAHGNLKAVGDVIFFETDTGHVQRTECVGLASDGSPAFECWESDREEATREIAEKGSSPDMTERLIPAEHVSQRADLLVTWKGCRVDKFDGVELAHPMALARPAFLLEPLSGCDALFITSIAIGDDDEGEQLAVDEVPAALFELPPAGPIILPALRPGQTLDLSFLNRGSSPALFVAWLGTPAGIAHKWERLAAQKVQLGGNRS